MSTPKTLTQHAVTWALAALFAFIVLALNAYLDSEHPETETAAITAQVVSDRAAEAVAMRGQP